MTENNEHTYLADTNIILDNPDIIEKLSSNGNTVLIVPPVFQELNDHKNGSHPALRKNSHHFSNILWEYQSNGNLLEGIDTKSGGKIKFFNEQSKPNLNFNADIGKEDLDILSYLNAAKDNYKGVSLVTNDKNLLILAQVNGLPAEICKDSDLERRGLYKGYRVCHNLDIYNEFLSSSKERDSRSLSNLSRYEELSGLVANEYVFFTSENELQDYLEPDKDKRRKSNSESILKYDRLHDRLVPIKYKDEKLMGFTPDSFEQKMAFDLALDTDIPLKVFYGPAGSGKTFIGLLGILQNLVNNRKTYGAKNGRSFLTRPIAPIEELGALPGDINEKFVPHLAGLRSNWEFIVKNSKEAEKHFRDNNIPFSFAQALKYNPDDPTDNKPVRIAPFAYLRGQSFKPGEMIFVDEAQNADIHKIRTAITRMGVSGGIVTGDTTQIDAPDVKHRDGLSHLVEKIETTQKPEWATLSGIVSLSLVSRSDLCTWGNEIL